MAPNGLTIAQIRQTATLLQPFLHRTPCVAWPAEGLKTRLAPHTELVLKLELFQKTGTFKIRGALSNMLKLSAEQKSRGVTTVSAGNHAIAVARAARLLGISAKVVMLATSNPYRVAAARADGAEVIVAADGGAGFELVNQIASAEGRVFVHPFEGELTALGTATVGLEFAEQAPALEALIVAIGGGGLAAGVSAAFKSLQPACRIYGVEPEGADAMHRSFEAGTPQRLERVSTVADSLAPPMTLPYSFGVCKANIDELVRVSDEQICRAVALMFYEMKLAVEPAGAAALAALLEPLSNVLSGKRVGVIVCGSNIDGESFAGYLRRGSATASDGG